MSETEAHVREIISERLGLQLQNVVPSALLIDDLGADSLDVIEIIMAVEDELHIQIPDEDADKIKSVRDLVEYAISRV